MEIKAIVFLPLSQGKVATIDFDDFEKVGRVKWSAKQSGVNWYAVRAVGPRGKQTRLWLHAEVMGAKGVDHKDGDGLNNRRDNLRRATQKFNTRAFRRKSAGKTSKFRGVTWFARDGVWKAQICIGQKTHFLGHHNKETQAARAYDSAVRRFGFQPEALNFP